MIFVQAVDVVAIILIVAAVFAHWLWARERKECPRCGHSWAEHLWGRGCQRAGCCCQGGIPLKKEAEDE